MVDQRLSELLLRYYEKSASSSEREELMALIRDGSREEAIKAVILDLFRNEQDFNETLDAEKAGDLLKFIYTAESGSRTPIESEGFEISRSRSGFRWYWAAAASVLIFLAGGLWLQFSKNSTRETVLSESGNLQPGDDRAQLTLWNGTVVNLDKDIKYGQKNMTINAEKGELIYNEMPHDFGFNLLKTPLGGQYKIVLPDGSTAWLNAGSSLRFPNKFGPDFREVEVTGEVFFDVTHQKNQPFVVNFPQKIAGATKIVVLGTEFNVSSYPDESFIQTTLVKGSVAVSRGNSKTILTPGQQAEVRISEKEDINVKQVDAESIAAWKEGRFEFAGNNIREIMRQISRWYAVDVEYEGDFSKKGFQGSISRKETAAEVLKFLELTGEVRFEIKDRKIRVIAL